MLHFVMIVVLACVAYDTLVCLGYIKTLEVGLSMYSVSEIKQKVHSRVFNKQQEKAEYEHGVWSCVWLPMSVLAIFNTGFLWWLFGHDAPVDTGYVAFSAFVVAAILVRVHSKNFFESWMVSWCESLTDARDIINIGIIQQRLVQIAETIEAKGEAITQDELMALNQEATVISSLAAHIHSTATTRKNSGLGILGESDPN